MDINDILFIKGPEGHGGPIFESQADLVRAIMKLPDGSFQDRNENSVKSFVNQALRPADAKNSRPISPNLRDALFAAIRIRLKDSRIDTEAVLRNVRIALEELKSGSHQTELGDEFTDLLRIAETATVHYIVTHKTSEETTSEKADKLINLMLRRLHLVSDLQDYPVSESERVQYIFNVKDDSAAIRFWKKLAEYLTNDKGIPPEEVMQKLDTVNSEKKTNRSLRVFYIDPIYCIHPTVVFDPDKPDMRDTYGEGRAGFHLHYHPNNQVSISKLSTDDLQEWYDLFYRKIQAKPEEFGQEEIPWKEKYLIKERR